MIWKKKQHLDNDWYSIMHQSFSIIIWTLHCEVHQPCIMINRGFRSPLSSIVAIKTQCPMETCLSPTRSKVHNAQLCTGAATSKGTSIVFKCIRKYVFIHKPWTINRNLYVLPICCNCIVGVSMLLASKCQSVVLSLIYCSLFFPQKKNKIHL